MKLFIHFVNADKDRAKVLKKNDGFIQWLTSHFLSFGLHSTYKEGHSYFIDVDDNMFQWGWDFLEKQCILHEFVIFKVPKCSCKCHLGVTTLSFDEDSCCDFRGVAI